MKKHLFALSLCLLLVAVACGLFEVKPPTFPRPGEICETIVFAGAIEATFCAGTLEQVRALEHAAASGRSYSVVRTVEGKK
jgi:ABC-type nitrate/sulfonate/bicarbonate transport system permease component